MAGLGPTKRMNLINEQNFAKRLLLPSDGAPLMTYEAHIILGEIQDSGPVSFEYLLHAAREQIPSLRLSREELEGFLAELTKDGKLTVHEDGAFEVAKPYSRNQKCRDTAAPQ